MRLVTEFPSMSVVELTFSVSSFLILSTCNLLTSKILRKHDGSRIDLGQ